MTTTTAVLTLAEARRLTAEIRTTAVHLDQLLIRAYEGQAWAAYRHPSFVVYLREEVPELETVKLRAPERRELVRRLGAQGATVTELAAASGAGRATIHRELADVRRPATVEGADGRRRQSRTGGVPRAAQVQGDAAPAGPFTAAVVALLAARGPLTALEVEQATGRRSATVAPALHRLAAAGRITHTPGTRRGRSGLYGPTTEGPR